MQPPTGQFGQLLRFGSINNEPTPGRHAQHGISHVSPRSLFEYLDKSQLIPTLCASISEDIPESAVPSLMFLRPFQRPKTRPLDYTDDPCPADGFYDPCRPSGATFVPSDRHRRSRRSSAEPLRNWTPCPGERGSKRAGQRVRAPTNRFCVWEASHVNRALDTRGGGVVGWGSLTTTFLDISRLPTGPAPHAQPRTAMDL